jgi:hypothetical protein
MAAKQGPNVLFCMPNRTKCILSVSQSTVGIRLLALHADGPLVAGLALAASVLQGYFQGKRDVERVLFDLYPEGGVALRPGFLYGTRQVGAVGVPLQIVGELMGGRTGRRTDRGTDRRAQASGIGVPLSKACLL